MNRITSLTDVVEWRLCIGCGACAYLRPEAVALKDFFAEGIRPVVSEEFADLGDVLQVCPAVESDFTIEGSTPEEPGGPGSIGDGPFVRDWGRVLEIWEGHATDSEIRFKGSSGGVLTAIAAFCIEQGGMAGVLHTGQHPADPIRNQTRLSRTREQLMAAAGSRYSPASVCDGLGLVEGASAPCAFIGKPGEIVALSKARKLRPMLDAKIGVTMSFFCAESPSTAGTVRLLEEMGGKTTDVSDLRYRGYGWPGHFAPIRKGETEPFGQIPYRESWSRLQSFRPWAVHLWPDGSGELADISCGDPWYEKPDGKNPGFSLIVVRSERGRDIVRAAIEAGYLTLTPAEMWKLSRSQQYLANKKAAVWGRMMALRLFRLPATRYLGAPLFSGWLTLPLKEKVKSTVGTIRRIIQRKLYRRLQLDHRTAVPVSPRQS